MTNYATKLIEESDRRRALVAARQAGREEGFDDTVRWLFENSGDYHEAGRKLFLLYHLLTEQERIQRVPQAEVARNLGLCRQSAARSVDRMRRKLREKRLYPQGPVDNGDAQQ